MARGPGKAIGIITDFDLGGDFERVQINCDDITVGRAGHEGARTIRLHEDARRAVTHRNLFHSFARSDVDHGYIWVAQHGDECQFPIESEFQAICAANAGSESLRHLLGCDINDGNGSVLRVGDPDFFSVWGNVEALRTVADLHNRLIPIASWRPHRPAWALRRRSTRLTGRRIRHSRWRWSAATRAANGFFDDAHGAGVDVCGDEALHVRRDVNHMRSV